MSRETYFIHFTRIERAIVFRGGETLGGGEERL